MPPDPVISIVDDDRSVLDSMARLMRSFGFTVMTFSSAVDFLASANIDETDCLIADVHMPDITGIELHRRLIEAGHSIPTILVTAYLDEIVRERALSAGIVCYMQKPFDETRLVGCLDLALNRGRSANQPE